MTPPSTIHHPPMHLFFNQCIVQVFLLFILPHIWICWDFEYFYLIEWKTILDKQLRVLLPSEIMFQKHVSFSFEAHSKHLNTNLSFLMCLTSFRSWLWTETVQSKTLRRNKVLFFFWLAEVAATWAPPTRTTAHWCRRTCFFVCARSHGWCGIPTFCRVIYSATLLEGLSTERRLEVQNISGGQLRGRYENVLV